MRLETFLERAWGNYLKVTPDAEKIHSLLTARGERIINDHVAFRTFNLPGFSRADLHPIFINWGYRKMDEELTFVEKKLKASYYVHPDSSNPKMFVSELLVEECSTELQNWIGKVVANRKTSSSPISADLFLNRTWNPVNYEDYVRFLDESEYAAWTAAFGIQVNHFTVLVNRLSTFKSLEELNHFLIGNGLTLNAAGGLIKGQPSELLEQSSTQSRKVPIEFAGAQFHSVMGCYYEFARRYCVPGTQELFQGFLPKSADKIFESTYEKDSH